MHSNNHKYIISYLLSRSSGSLQRNVAVCTNFLDQGVPRPVFVFRARLPMDAADRPSGDPGTMRRRDGEAFSAQQHGDPALAPRGLSLRRFFHGARQFTRAASSAPAMRPAARASSPGVGLDGRHLELSGSQASAS
jgi:hypothetical protein